MRHADHKKNISKVIWTIPMPYFTEKGACASAKVPLCSISKLTWKYELGLIYGYFEVIDN